MYNNIRYYSDEFVQIIARIFRNIDGIELQKDSFIKNINEYVKRPEEVRYKDFSFGLRPLSFLGEVVKNPEVLTIKYDVKNKKIHVDIDFFGFNVNWSFETKIIYDDSALIQDSLKEFILLEFRAVYIVGDCWTIRSVFNYDDLIDLCFD